MSRIGLLPVKIKDGVEVTAADGVVVVKGKLGESTIVYPQGIVVVVEGSEVKVTRTTEIKKIKSMHGTVRMLISNAIEGVDKGFEKKLELVGVGYRVKMEGKSISLSLGLNHPVIVEPVEGTVLEVEGETMITVKGYDKQKVGEMAAKIREIKKPEPYKGKGIRYEGEYVRRKSAKVVAA